MNSEIPLGKATSYTHRYDASLLHAIPRVDSRAELGLGSELPFSGCDLWNAWDLTWLDDAGVPQVAVLEVEVPADSPNIVESKSLKLYLNSFSLTRIASNDALARIIQRDLGHCTGAEVSLQLHGPDTEFAVGSLPGECLDSISTECRSYEVDAGFLVTGNEVVNESLYSHLLRSLCPVTNQPDVGSLSIEYSGPRIDRAGLLQYIVSFREHNDFHEACVERMFVDIMGRCAPAQLSIYARYQRRGGIDINPFRSSIADPAATKTRLWRQ